MDKRERMWQMLEQVQNILRIQNPIKAERWSLTYLRIDAGNICDFTEWQKQYHRIREGEEYCFIWELPAESVGTPILLYSLNMTCEKESYAIGRLMTLIGDKF